MTIHVLQAARYIAERSEWTLSNLQLQKLLYVANMLHLAEQKTPLVQDAFQAWDYGPVHPVLYRSIKHFGASPVTDLGYPKHIDDGTARRILDQVFDHLAHKSGGDLVAITHWNKGAWAKNYIPNQQGIPIPDKDILSEYHARVSASSND